MPLVVVHRENKFNKVLIQMRNSGGARANAYRRIGEIRQTLELGQRNACQTTDHGENRIRNCVKYDLGNGFRLVTVDFGDVVMLCHAGSHDEVDHWLEANRGQTFTYDRNTRRIEVIVEREIRHTPHLPAATTPPEDQRPYLSHLPGLDWEKLIPLPGARRPLLALDAQSSEEEIIQVLEIVELAAGVETANLALNLIIALRDGHIAVAEIHRDVFLGIRQRASETAPITPEVVKSESNSDTLVVLNDLSEQEFDDLWDPARFQEWMLYLHPGQKRVVVEDMPKPCVFTGVSGSGKTCVLVHRAIRLAKAYPDESILVLSLNRSLAELIENHIRRLDATVKPRIRVMAFYDYLESLLKFHGLEDFLTSFGELLNIKEEVSKFVGSRELTQLNTLFDARDEYEIQRLWGDFCADPQSHAAKVALTRLTFYLYSQDQAIDAPRYLQEELTLVRSACRLSFHYKSYAQYARGGRCIPFQDKRREDVLELLRFWERHQLRHGKLDGMELTQAALVVLDDRGGSIPEHLRFRSVLVDEFQDFSTLDLELIAKIPKEALNGLFLTGDTAQKIYTKDFDLPGAGMGRGQRLDRSILKNYRNSRQILEAAHLLLESYADEATARHEGVSVLKPEYAQRDGARPFVCPTNDPFQAAWKLAGEWLAAGYPGFTICIATANPDVLSVRALRDAAPAGIATSRLTGDYQMRAEEVVVSDIYNIKGFEFSLIILVGMGASEFPPKGVPAGEIWREALRLYVAMTRGRDEVCLVHAGEASPFLEAMKAAVSPRPLAFAQPAKFAPATPAPIAPVAVPASDKPAPPPAIVAPPAGLPVMPVPAPGKVSTEPARPEAPKPSLVESVQGPGDRAPVPPPAEQQATVINGVTLIRIEGEATVFSLAAVLGKEVVQIHNDVMNLGVYMNPSEALMPAFVYKVMDKYGCAPIFKK